MNLLDLKSSPILRFLTGKKRPPKQPAVSDSTVNSLRLLTATPEWKIYKLLLDMLVSNSVKGLLAAGEDSQCHYLRGYTQGLLHSAQIPEQLIAQADDARSRTDRINESNAARANASKSALYGTSLWD